jgi:two-component system OmpR family sensor kinase
MLEVADTGPGIYPEDISHLYDRFYRGKQNRASIVPGAGLGLSIVKELVDLHHGSIEVQSQPGVGTTFSVTLPAIDIEGEIGGELARELMEKKKNEVKG